MVRPTLDSGFSIEKPLESSRRRASTNSPFEKPMPTGTTSFVKVADVSRVHTSNVQVFRVASAPESANTCRCETRMGAKCWYFCRTPLRSHASRGWGFDWAPAPDGGRTFSSQVVWPLPAAARSNAWPQVERDAWSECGRAAEVTTGHHVVPGRSCGLIAKSKECTT